MQRRPIRYREIVLTVTSLKKKVKLETGNQKSKSKIENAFGAFRSFQLPTPDDRHEPVVRTRQSRGSPARWSKGSEGSINHAVQRAVALWSSAPLAPDLRLECAPRTRSLPLAVLRG